MNLSRRREHHCSTGSDLSDDSTVVNDYPEECEALVGAAYRMGTRDAIVLLASWYAVIGSYGKS